MSERPDDAGPGAPAERTPSRAGFTLIEVLSVLGIVALLAALVMGLTRYAGSVAREARARADLEKLADAAGSHFARYGSYPSWDELRTQAAADGLSFTNGVGPVDPWGTLYGYTNPSAFAFVLFSCGPDGSAGSPDDIHPGR